jgi:hypothetical protein
MWPLAARRCGGAAWRSLSGGLVIANKESRVSAMQCNFARSPHFDEKTTLL